MDFIPENLVKLKNYGCIKVTLNEMLIKRGVSKSKFAKLLNSNYNVVSRYCSGGKLRQIDLDFIARACCVLRCEITDILKYVPKE